MEMDFSEIVWILSTYREQGIIEKLKTFFDTLQQVSKLLNTSFADAKNGNIAQSSELLNQARSIFNMTVKPMFDEIERYVIGRDSQTIIHLRSLMQQNYNHAVETIDMLSDLLRRLKKLESVSGSKVEMSRSLSLFKAATQSAISAIQSAVQIAKNPNTLRTAAAGGAGALAVGIVTAAEITAVAGGGYLLGLIVTHIPTGKDKNGKQKNVGDDITSWFYNAGQKDSYYQDILPDKPWHKK